MKIEKIKSIQADFHDGCGPSETITLGFQVDGGHSYILGRFYFGPAMNKVHKELFEQTEDFIDTVINLFVCK